MSERVIFLAAYPQSYICSLLKPSRQQIKPVVFVLNALSGEDTSNHLGHWMAIYLNYQTLTLGYFNSYMLSLLVNSLVLHAFIQTHTHIAVSRLAYRLQGTHSVVCGIYAMYFCYLVSHQSLKHAMQCLHMSCSVCIKKGQYAYNDKLITHLGYKLFHIPSCVKKKVLLLELL